MNAMNFEDKSICLIVWNMQKEDDVHVYLGKLHVENGKPSFVNEENGWKVSLDEEQISSLKPVSDDLKEMLLNADYALSMNLGELPQSSLKEYRATGMKWHD